VLDATKGDVAKTLSSEILEGGKRASAAGDAAEKLLGEEEEAYAGYLKAKADYCALGVTDKVNDIAVTAVSSLTKTGGVKLTVTEREKVFEFQKAKRVWRLKYNALEKLGMTPAERELNDFCDL
jgi:hypothetical protein